MIRQAKIVIGTEVQQPAAIRQHDLRLLLADNLPLTLEQSFLFSAGQLSFKLLIEFLTHLYPPQIIFCDTDY